MNMAPFGSGPRTWKGLMADLANGRWNPRTFLAFLIAPLCVPVLTVMSATGAASDGPRMFIHVDAYELASIGAIVGYSGTLLFGMPAFLLLRSYRVTAFFVAPLVGAMLAIVTFTVAAFVVALLLGVAPLQALLTILEGLHSPAELIKPGLIGAVVGSCFWIIARPDRTSQWQLRKAE